MNLGIRAVVGGLACAALASCDNSSSVPSVAEIQQHQAAWASHHLTRYAYRYMTSGYFISWDGQLMRLVVLGDTVRSAQFVATNDSVPGAAGLPTIDRLFQQAIAARENGALLAADFDTTLGFPTRLVFDGPPDASGSVTASGIEFLP